jgi:hypothetical protein
LEKLFSKVLRQKALFTCKNCEHDFS